MNRSITRRKLLLLTAGYAATMVLLILAICSAMFGDHQVPFLAVVPVAAAACVLVLLVLIEVTSKP